LLIETITGGKNYTNCYILRVAPSPRVIVIDPGEYESEKTLSYLRENNLQIDYIILTHEHWDHIIGANKLREHFPCRLVCSEECAEALIDPRKNLSKYFMGREIILSPHDATFKGLNNVLLWQGIKITFYRLPGHSQGSYCIAVGNYLFTGDTIIKNQKTVTNLPGGNKQMLEKSLDFIMNHRDGDTVIYPGHGDSYFLREVDKAAAMGITGP
jgi:glyoxylase-like metal-dependent hydrolase (beta-lactamase superfamily II)